MHDQDNTLEALFSMVKELCTINDPEHYKAIMRGEIPLDDNDEGLEAVDLNAGLKQVYEYFNLVIDEYETAMARDHFLSGKET